MNRHPALLEFCPLTICLRFWVATHCGCGWWHPSKGLICAVSAHHCGSVPSETLGKTAAPAADTLQPLNRSTLFSHIVRSSSRNFDPWSMDNTDLSRSETIIRWAFPYVCLAESFGGSGSLYCPLQLTGVTPSPALMIRGNHATCTNLRCTFYARSADYPDPRTYGQCVPVAARGAGMSSSRHGARRGQASSAALFGCHAASCNDLAVVANGEYAVGRRPALRSGDSGSGVPLGHNATCSRRRGMRKVPFRDTRTTGVRSFRIPRSASFLRTRVPGPAPPNSWSHPFVLSPGGRRIKTMYYN